MKFKLAVIALGIFAGSVEASQECKDHAEAAVELREDYKSYQEVADSVALSWASASRLEGPGAATIQGSIQIRLILGQEVFLHSGGAKGPKLYKIVYNKCVAYDKQIADRAAKQAAREAKRSQ